MKFEKVSLTQFTKDVKALYPWLEDDAIEVMWNNIKLPQRSTSGSAGYDFYSPMSISLSQGTSAVIPTGIRAEIDEGYFLMCVPRSGLGFRYGMKLNNTLPIIDSDYYDAENEGHIMASISCHPNKFMRIEEGDRFIQGIFVKYGITDDDNASGMRTGGMGSTGK